MSSKKEEPRGDPLLGTPNGDSSPRRKNSPIYEYMKPYIQKWNAKNQDKIKAHNTAEVKCEICDKTMCRYSMFLHIKSKKHIFNTTGVKILLKGEIDQEQVKADTLTFLTTHVSMAGLGINSEDKELESIWL